MAYSNLGTPVFYIDEIQSRRIAGIPLVPEAGYDGSVSLYYSPNMENEAYNELWNMTPETQTTLSRNETLSFSIPIRNTNYTNGLENPVFESTDNMRWYLAYLNCNFDAESVFETFGENTDYVINEGKQGFQITVADSNYILDDDYFRFTFTTPLEDFPRIGAIATGVQYKMPNSPDLNLTMETIFDGVKTIKTAGGGSTYNIKYTSPKPWRQVGSGGTGKQNPFESWETWTSYYTPSRTGRKKWKLKFSYLDSKDIFPSNIKANYYTEHGNENDTEYDSGDINTGNQSLSFNIGNDDSFISQVWNKTMGGAIPFTFQPDSTNFDEFYMCRFNQKSFKTSRIAKNLHSISLDIEEVW